MNRRAQAGCKAVEAACAFDGCEEVSTRWLDKGLLLKLAREVPEPRTPPFPSAPASRMGAASEVGHDPLGCPITVRPSGVEPEWRTRSRMPSDLPMAEALRRLCEE